MHGLVSWVSVLCMAISSDVVGAQVLVDRQAQDVPMECRLGCDRINSQLSLVSDRFVFFRFEIDHYRLELPTERLLHVRIRKRTLQLFGVSRHCNEHYGLQRGSARA